MRFGLCDSILDGESVLAAQFILRGGVLNELIRPTDADNRCCDVLVTEQLQHRRTITAHQRVIFQRHNHVRRATEQLMRGSINRLGETRIDDSHIVIVPDKLYRLAKLCCTSALPISIAAG